MQSSTEDINVVLRITKTVAAYSDAHGGLPADLDGIENLAVAIIEGQEHDDFQIVDLVETRQNGAPATGV